MTFIPYIMYKNHRRFSSQILSHGSITEIHFILQKCTLNLMVLTHEYYFMIIMAIMIYLLLEHGAADPLHAPVQNGLLGHLYLSSSE